MMNIVIENKGREEGSNEKVTLKELAEHCGFQCLFGELEDTVTFSSVSVNRPGLYLSGYDEYFAESRAQVMGNAEMYYMHGHTEKQREKIYDKFFSNRFPCLILSRGIKPTDEMLEAARKYNVPVLVSSKMTSEVVNKMVVYLNRLLAPSITLYGGFININGIGVLLIGESGIGKSETTLELVHRGHRLIADDAVIIKRIREELLGYAPSVTKGFMEIRGVGIVDVVRIYGVGAIQDQKDIDLVIELEHWKSGKEYDRIGRDREFMDILGVKLPKIVIPVTAGRNLAIVIEIAAGTQRLRKTGYIAADEIEKRMMNIKK